MPTSDSSRDALLERLAEEFVERHRRGERPALSEYISRHPDLADEVRDLFPALVQIEKLKPVAGDLTGAFIATSTSHAEPLPERFGEFRILRQVGQGGMGVVYEAEQESLSRHVALKVLPRQALLKATYLERFRREAKAAGRLHHTNIVPVFGVGECDGTHYYAMQFIRGEGLDKVLCDLRVLKNTPVDSTVVARPSEGSVAHSLLSCGFVMPPVGSTEDSAARSVPSGLKSVDGTHGSSSFSAGSPEGQYFRGIARLGLQVADALAYAHRQGILHRDIKPSNLLLDQQGTLWITDFGLAKAEGADDLTQTGDIVGTVRFMAPERFEGRSLPQSDVYALGVTLYELLTLRPAFDDRNKVRLVETVLHEPPVQPRKIDPSIPRDLETVVLKCLAKNPQERYASAEALADDLRRFLMDRPILARRINWRERTWRWCRRNPAVAGLLTTVAVLLLAVAAISSGSAVWLKAALTEAENEKTKAESAEREQKKQLYQGFVTEATYRRYSRRQGQRFDSLEAIRQALRLLPELDLSDADKEKQRDTLRDLAISCLTLPDVRVAKEWDGWPEGSNGLAFDERQELYARADKQGNITIRRLADDREVYAIAGDGKPVRFEFQAGERALVLCRSTNQFECWPIGASQPTWATSVPYSPMTYRLARNGRLLAAVRPDATLIVYNLPGGTVRRQVRGIDSQATVEFSPDGRYLAFATGLYGEAQGHKLHILDLQSEAPPLVFTHPDWIHTAVWYPDSRTIAAGGTNTTAVVVWDVPSGKRLDTVTAQKGGAPYLGINRRGDLLASASGWWGGVRIWHPQTGQHLLTLPEQRSGFPYATADGRLFSYTRANEKIHIEECVPSQVRRSLVRDLRAPKGKQCYIPSLHPGGRLLAVGMENGVGLWDVPSCREVAFLPIDYTENVLFEPSGSLLTYGYAGLNRWTIKPPARSGGEWTIGPPQTLLHAYSWDRRIAVSRDGKVVAAAIVDGAVVFNAERGNQPMRLGPHSNDVRRIAVSPDGRYVVSVAFDPHGAKVWEAATGKHVADLLPTHSGFRPSFTPDGKYLICNNRWFEVDTWKEVPGVEGWNGAYGCISPSGELLACEGGRLFDRQSGRNLANLTSPDQGRVPFLTFNHDGTKLIGTDMDNLVIHVWDLRKLRAELRALDLDWDAPAYPPDLEDAQPPREPPRLRVDLGSLEDDEVLGSRPSKQHLQTVAGVNSVVLMFQPLNFKAYRQRGRAYGALKEHRQAIADYCTALALLPSGDSNRIDLLSRRAGNYLALGALEDALADFREAERLDAASGAAIRRTHASNLVQDSLERQERDPAAALLLLRQAVQIDPNHGLDRNNLAWILLTGPKKLRDVPGALTHARAAVKGHDGKRYLNTLGVALYRNAKYAEALPILEKSLADSENQSQGHDLFFLALCHLKLGDHGKAKEYFDRAVQWTAAKKNLPAGWKEELLEFQIEAAAELQAR
jgi:serine/threonine protein kinase/WD40 repeat protein/tetratricopeptide (TPR) repeat protein